MNALSWYLFFMMDLKNITITCKDNTSLAATLFKPSDVKGAVLIAPATGIVRQFYTSFAKHLTEQGFGVIIFDNRGIGGSLKGNIKDSEASLVDWGAIDTVAALERLIQEFPNTKYHLVGHSAGGQLIGLMSNAEDLSSVFNYASSSGQLTNMKFPFNVRAQFFMNIFIPLSNLIFGYTKSPLMGMGEPLPKHAGRQWKEWCNGDGYVKTTFGKEVKQHWYNEFDVPSFWVNASDDDIANTKNVQDMLKVFPKLKAKVLELNPSDYNVSDIGHMKFFSKRRKELWPIATDWLEQHTNN